VTALEPRKGVRRAYRLELNDLQEVAKSPSQASRLLFTIQRTIMTNLFDKGLIALKDPNTGREQGVIIDFTPTSGYLELAVVLKKNVALPTINFTFPLFEKEEPITVTLREV